MNLSLKTLFILIGAGLCASIEESANAEGSIDKHTQTFFFNADGGLSTYKSEMVESNDTSTTVGYGFGVYAGRERNLGMFLRNEQTTVPFALNDASIALSWQDTTLRYRYGPVYCGIMFSNSAWEVEKKPDENSDAQEFLNITTSGYGANLGVQIPAGKSSFLYIDVASVSTTKIQEKPPLQADGTLSNEQRDIALGSRTDINLGGSFDLTKRAIDGLVGYKYRTYALTVEGEAYAELHTTTYFGVQVGWQF